jgi:hypothetical protein
MGASATFSSLLAPPRHDACPQKLDQDGEGASATGS